MTLVAESDVLTGLPFSTGRRWTQRAPVRLIAYPFPMSVRYSILRLRARTLLPAAQRFQQHLQQTARRLSLQRL